jgi:FkbM family methyltransferase
VITSHQLATEDRFVLETMCRAQVQPVFLGDYTAVCRALGRYKLYVDTRDRGFATNVLLDGFWETWLTQFIARIVRPGMVAIDVGANFGYYTLLLADLVGVSGRVISVEPNPDVVHHLRNSINLNGFDCRATIVAAAAGAQTTDQVNLFAPSGEAKNARVVGDGEISAFGEGVIHTVAQVSIDSVVGNTDRIDFVKIDAEGAEGEIIDGMRDVLAQHQPALVLEFNALRGDAPDELLRKLEAVYGRIHYLDFYGKAIVIDAGRVMSESRGVDWLLYFAKNRNDAS